MKDLKLIVKNAYINEAVTIRNLKRSLAIFVLNISGWERLKFPLLSEFLGLDIMLNMHKYELIIIIDPETQEKRRKELTDEINSWVEKEKGKVVKLDDWGKKPLSYSIKKTNYGFYFFFDLELEAIAAQNIEKKIKLEEEIIRYLMIRKD